MFDPSYNGGFNQPGNRQRSGGEMAFDSLTNKSPVLRTKSAENATDDEKEHESSISSASKIASGGFVLLSSLLTFFGITGGAIPDLVRNYPSQSVAIAIALGLGLVLALLSPLAKPFTKVLASLVLAGALLSLALPVVLLTGEDFTPRPYWPLLLIGAIIAIAVIGFVAQIFVLGWMEVKIAILVLALFCTGTGLYWALRMIVDDLEYPEAPYLTVTATSESQLQINVEAKLEGPEDDPIVLQVWGFPGSVETDRALEDQGQVRMAWFLVPPNNGGNADGEFTIQIEPEAWAQVQVYACNTFAYRKKDPPGQSGVDEPPLLLDAEPDQLPTPSELVESVCTSAFVPGGALKPEQVVDSKRAVEGVLSVTSSGYLKATVTQSARKSADPAAGSLWICKNNSQAQVLWRTTLTRQDTPQTVSFEIPPGDPEAGRSLYLFYRDGDGLPECAVDSPLVLSSLLYDSAWPK